MECMPVGWSKGKGGGNERDPPWLGLTSRVSASSEKPGVPMARPHVPFLASLYSVAHQSSELNCFL